MGLVSANPAEHAQTLIHRLEALLEIVDASRELRDLPNQFLQACRPNECQDRDDGNRNQQKNQDNREE